MFVPFRLTFAPCTSPKNFKDFLQVIGNAGVSFGDIFAAYEKLFEWTHMFSAVDYMGVSNQQDASDAFVHLHI